MRNIYLSLDPYMRGRMSAAKSYAEPAAIGRADGRRHGRGDRRVAQSGLRGRRYRRRLWRLAARAAMARACASSIPRRRRSRPRSGSSACPDDRLCGSARNRPAEARRNRRARGGLRRGRLGGRADRQDQGMPCRRHRRRRREMPLRRRRARLRRLHRSSRARFCRAARSRLSARGSTSISRMSAAPCSKRCGRCSMISPAFRSAGSSRSTTSPPRCRGRTCSRSCASAFSLRGFIVSDFAAKQADFLREMGEWVGGPPQIPRGHRRRAGEGARGVPRPAAGQEFRQA